jgi:hypothetical protein
MRKNCYISEFVEIYYIGIFFNFKRKGVAGVFGTKVVKFWSENFCRGKIVKKVFPFLTAKDCKIFNGKIFDLVKLLLWKICQISKRGKFSYYEDTDRIIRCIFCRGKIVNFFIPFTIYRFFMVEDCYIF